MFTNYSVVILASILAIGFTQSDPELTKRMDALSAVVCAANLEITDAQIADIRKTCTCDGAKAKEEVFKTCLKANPVTDRQAVTVLCAPEKDCVQKEWAKSYLAIKPEEQKKTLEGYEKYTECVKTALKK